MAAAARGVDSPAVALDRHQAGCVTCRSTRYLSLCPEGQRLFDQYQAARRRGDAWREQDPFVLEELPALEPDPGPPAPVPTGEYFHRQAERHAARCWRCREGVPCGTAEDYRRLAERALRPFRPAVKIEKN